MLHDISVFMKFYPLLFKPLGPVFLDLVASVECIRPNEHPCTNCCSFALICGFQMPGAWQVESNSWLGHLSGMCEGTLTSIVAPILCLCV